MADVEISYNNSVIASLSDSGTEVLETNGTFMADDVTITYEKSGGGGGVAKTVRVDLGYTYGGASYFRSFTIYETTDGVKGQQIGSIPTYEGTATVTVSASANGLVCELRGGYVVLGSRDYTITTGGVGLARIDEHGDVDVYFIVAYDGTAGIDHVDWDD